MQKKIWNRKKNLKLPKKICFFPEEGKFFSEFFRKWLILKINFIERNYNEFVCSKLGKMRIWNYFLVFIGFVFFPRSYICMLGGIFSTSDQTQTFSTCWNTHNLLPTDCGENFSNSRISNWKFTLTKTDFDKLSLKKGYK